MTILKRILKYISLFILAIILFVGLYLLSAYFFSRIEVKAEPKTTDDVSIYLMTNGMHSDIVVPVKTKLIDWSKKVKFANTKGKDSLKQYVAFGWGDREFYLEIPTWADLKFKTAFKAVFGLSATAMHVTFYQTMSECTDCKKIMLSTEQYSRLVKYIEKSFTTDKDGHFVNIITTANYGNDDAFYEAKGSYNLFFTCNIWTNKALKVCGQKACLWTPSDKGIFEHYK